MRVARRPSNCRSASTTYHSRVTSPGLAFQVFTVMRKKGEPESAGAGS